MAVEFCKLTILRVVSIPWFTLSSTLAWSGCILFHIIANRLSNDSQHFRANKCWELLGSLYNRERFLLRYFIKLDIYKAATLGVSASVCLMVVGRSIEVCHKLAYSLAETDHHFEKDAPRKKHFWSTIGHQLLSRTVSLHHTCEMKLN